MINDSKPILAELRKIGIEVGKSFEIGKLDPAVQRALETAPHDAQNLMAWKLPTLTRVANGWVMNTDTVGVYGNYYLKRAILAQQGLGANVVQDAIYPLNLGDETGKPLDGAMPFKHNGDGSLNFYIQNESSGKDQEANWLPAPKAPFNLLPRMYASKSEALTGKWNPPPVTKAQGISTLAAQ